MKCPACKDVLLTEVELEQGLAAHRCERCGGQWLNGTAYLRWVELRPPKSHSAKGDTPAAASDESSAAPAADNLKAKLCPECGRFLGRTKVGHGVVFYLERCGGCGGIWFDHNEWEVLKAHGMHDDVHFMFADAWKANVAGREREVQHERLLVQKVGEADWAELKRVRAWLDAHPHRAELYAALLQHVEPWASRVGKSDAIATSQRAG